MSNKGPDWSDLTRAAASRLAECGIAGARVDAELLALHVSGLTRSSLLIADPPDDGARVRFEHLVARRCAREPLQHLTGSAAFRRTEVAVGPGVFVPRPETELLVDWALHVAPDRGLVIDACTGSGAIAKALAEERPELRLWAIEVDEDAYDWADANVADNGNVALIHADATASGTLSELDGTVDVVVSNPPYVPADIDVAPEVHWDPDHAVFAEDNGLAVISELVERARTWLRPQGHLGFEHDETHADEVRARLRWAGYRDIETHTDLTNRPRYTTAVNGP
ncbi:peptide chain release factor N(5)-glutamine methyltransferase [Haloglycomyces albus]|uniref:peptide chain release factor N(5)-glutamine methyltransferase n=1 Tax=Haloglycomyces albus TaxID=526067 RepID=UPI00046D93EF|nr:peptide chain release factor N(5)-glutamine methyltransferase [Haloglycomyces albus]